MHFWYHMFGNAIGSLQVFKKPGNGNATKIWQLHGVQGNMWKGGVVQISSNSPYQVNNLGYYLGQMAKGWCTHSVSQND